MTGTRTTRDDLDVKMAEAREAVTEAERKLGAASLDGKGEATARKALESARQDEEATAGAIAELEHREAEAAREQAEGAARDQRLAIYEWCRAYLPLCAAVVSAREAMERAEAAASALTAPARVRRLKPAGRGHGLERVTEIKPDGTRWTATRTLQESELDLQLLDGTPAPGLKGVVYPNFTVARAAELVERAEMLIKAEREGKGAEVAVTGAERAAKRAADRKAERQANQEAQRKARAAAEAKAATDAAEAKRRRLRPETREQRRERLTAEAGSNILNPVPQ